MTTLIPPLITSKTAREILDGSRYVSLDLGLTKESISVEGDWIQLRPGVLINFSDLESITDHMNAVYFVDGNKTFQVAISNAGYYKLVPTEGAPTLEIDGIRMHRTKDTLPEFDAESKLDTLGLRGGNTLETCMGLGYTSISSIKRGSKTVVTIERRSEVIRIAMLNPWSKKLFEGDVNLLLGDSFCAIEALPREFFDYIIHDPPRLTLAGDLYSEEFYKRLYRVISHHGSLFHYTGQPGSKYRGVSLQKGIQRRLISVGFRNTVYHPNVMGITCDR